MNSFDLAEQHVEPADEAEVAHDRPGEETDHVLVVRRERRIHRRDVALFVGVQVAEDDLALLLGGELLQRHPLMEHVAGSRSDRFLYSR